MIGPLAKSVRASNSFKIVLRYFGKVYRKSNVYIIRFDWLIALYFFISLVCNESFIKVNKTKWRPIYKVIDEAYIEESNIFPEDLSENVQTFKRRT